MKKTVLVGVLLAFAMTGCSSSGDSVVRMDETNKSPVVQFDTSLDLIEQGEFEEAHKQINSFPWADLDGNRKVLGYACDEFLKWKIQNQEKGLEESIESTYRIFQLIRSEFTADQQKTILAIYEQIPMHVIEAVFDSGKVYYDRPLVGMTERQASHTGWGKPQKKNKTTSSKGTIEQWVFYGNRYLYTDENNMVTTIQE